MMNGIGKHMKFTAAESTRQAVGAFYGDVLGCSVQSPQPQLDVFTFQDGRVLGFYFVADDEANSLSQHERSTWIELAVDDQDRVTSALADLGIAQMEYPDKDHRYFQGPGGLVFRLCDA